MDREARAALKDDSRDDVDDLTGDDEPKQVKKNNKRLKLSKLNGGATATSEASGGLNYAAIAIMLMFGLPMLLGGVIYVSGCITLVITLF